NDQLKNICQIEHTRHRSVANFVVNLLAGLVAYTYQEKKPSLNLYPDDLPALPATVFQALLRKTHVKPMGDLSTHKAIFSDVVKPILRDGLGITDSQVMSFDLGNWLRDVSQFRDPYAMKLGKLEKFRERIHGKNKAAAHIASKLLNQLLGPHDKYDVGKEIVTGAFGEWFKHMITAFGLF